MGRIGDWLRGYKRVHVLAAIPIKSTQDDEISNMTGNSIRFPGWDSLELYWDPEKDKLVFLQEFGGYNELEDEDIENMIELCMKFLRRDKNGAGHYLQ